MLKFVLNVMLIFVLSMDNAHAYLGPGMGIGVFAVIIVFIFSILLLGFTIIKKIIIKIKNILSLNSKKENNSNENKK